MNWGTAQQFRKIIPLMLQGLIFLTHENESVVLASNIKNKISVTYLIQNDMQNKFLKSNHFTVFKNFGHQCPDLLQENIVNTTLL